MFARFLRSVAECEGMAPTALGPITRQASGLVKLPPGRSDRMLIAEVLSEKYGLRK
jgi:hypothetical protein